ncbi:MAG: chemotaxis protein CheA [Acidobacteria bacterium]|nr:MAG: chemotaxis protein CheA [Acidobacteriota bacterium]
MRFRTDIVSNEFSQDPALLQEFLIESEELLEGMNQDLVALEQAPDDTELLNRIFRALHTIKGTSGFLNFDPVVRLSHRAEDVLNTLRRSEVEFSRRIMDALLAARDQLSIMLQDIREGGLKDYALDGLIAELEAVQKPAPAPSRLGDILVAEGVIAPGALQDVLQQQAQSGEIRKIGELLVEKGLASQTDVSNALARQKRQADSVIAAQTMRVDVRKLDELINLVGELVLERNRLYQLSRELSMGRLEMQDLTEAFSQSTARLSFITEELQAAGLRARMVPIDTVFRKFPRLVRDVAHNLKKEVDLLVSGEDTELDKTMVEMIGDPLVHLVRNSLDHGLELPDVRESAGKPRKGTIRLEARQEGDQIIISVADDGAGIDPARIAKKAMEKGLVTADRLRTMTTREILDFVFLPGFSTAEKISDLSGRGVGMDVVRSNLTKLNGTIELESKLGAGTTVFLRLPLTLAILPVLLVEVGNEIYALPLRSVVETARIRATELHRFEGSELLHLRGETVPLLRLRQIFKVQYRADEKGSDKVVILGIGERRFALLVDNLIGQESTVIKPLGSYLHHCSGIAGATISGDGRVRLVLDPADLLASASNSVAQGLTQ